MKKVKVWIYIRVSTKEQVKNGFWKDLQLTKIKKFIEYNFDKWYEFDENLVYKDLWISWAKDELDRPWLNQMKLDMKKWKIDVIIVYKLDRLARKTRLILELIDYMKFYNVEFISTNENIDTNSPTWNFFLTILWAIWEMDRDLIMEKTMAGSLEWVRKWFFSTWWSPIYWFTKNKDTKKLEIVENEAEIIKEIFYLYTKENKSLNEISKILTTRKVETKFDTLWRTRKNKDNFWKWNASTISQMLSNEAYIGLYWLNKTKNEYYIATDEIWREIKKKRRVKREKKEWLALEVENIIDVEIFEKAQKKLVENPFRNNNNNKSITKHLFAHLIECWVCKSNYKWDKWKIDKEWNLRAYYRCWKNSYAKHWWNKCFNSQIREIELIKNIFHEINKFFKNPNLIIKKYLNENKSQNETKKYKKEVENNNEIIKKNLDNVEKLFDRFIEEENEQFKSIIQKKINRNRWDIESLEKRNIEIKEIIENNNKIIHDTKAFESYIEEFRWQDIFLLDREKQIAILSKIIKKIIIFENDVNVVFIFRDTEFLDENLNTKKEPNHKWRSSFCFLVNGGSSGARTQDLVLKRDLLYQLS